eukprot:1625017-Rhodomonas_salina.2
MQRPLAWSSLACMLVLLELGIYKVVTSDWRGRIARLWRYQNPYGPMLCCIWSYAFVYGPTPLLCAMVLRLSYGVSGTEKGYGAPRWVKEAMEARYEPHCQIR